MKKPYAGRGQPRTGARSRGPRSPADRRADRLFIYGIHPVLAALANPKRRIAELHATRNALARLTAAGAALPAMVVETTPRALDRLLGGDAVHQGVAAEAAPLAPPSLEDLRDAAMLVVLDQITDPHNVGAILRSAAALGADAVVTTARHAPQETGVLAKAASGALDLLPLVFVSNLARALIALGDRGFTRVGLDSAGSRPLESAMTGQRIALVLGAEGKGLRKLTRDTCDSLARIPTRGPIASLNVSNAAAVALYLAARHLETVADHQPARGSGC